MGVVWTCFWAFVFKNFPFKSMFDGVNLNCKLNSSLVMSCCPGKGLIGMLQRHPFLSLSTQIVSEVG